MYGVTTPVYRKFCMTSRHLRIVNDLNIAFRSFGAPADITADGDTVTVPASTAQHLLASLRDIEGGGRVPFIRALMPNPHADVVLVGDQALHLHRALMEVQHAQRRADQIDRGIIPGALSGAEALRLARKHPHLFR